MTKSEVPNPEWLKSASWLPLVATFVIAFSQSALLSILLILQNEVFPTEIRCTFKSWYLKFMWCYMNNLIFLSRSISVGIVEGLSCAARTLTIKTFPALVECLTFHGAFYFYSIIALILTIWAMLGVKQTDGLSLVETERLYDQGPASLSHFSNASISKKYEAVADSRNVSSK